MAVSGAKSSTKTYNTRDSPVVTHLSTSLAVCSLSRAERTGCRVLYSVWSYVPVDPVISEHHTIFLKSLRCFIFYLTSQGAYLIPGLIVMVSVDLKHPQCALWRQGKAAETMKFGPSRGPLQTWYVMGSFLELETLTSSGSSSLGHRL